jgi:hypothetical protein
MQGQLSPKLISVQLVTQNARHRNSRTRQDIILSVL